MCGCDEDNNKKWNQETKWCEWERIQLAGFPDESRGKTSLDDGRSVDYTLLEETDTSVCCVLLRDLIHWYYTQKH